MVLHKIRTYSLTRIFQKIISYSLISISAILLIVPANAQTASIKPGIKLESWLLIPMSANSSDESISPKTDIFLRRLRFGAKGKISKRISYAFSIAGDRWGLDADSPEGGKHKGLFLWNAFLSAKIFQESDLLHLHAGYLCTAVSRESNTSTWLVSSLDKSYPNAMLRKFVSGKFNGIESGIALGGNYFQNKTGLMYRAGLYFPKKYLNEKSGSPLITCRIALIAGEAEQEKYKYMISENPFHQRKGISLGIGGSHQQKTFNNTDSLQIRSNSSAGIDLLIEHNFFQLDAEYYYMFMEQKHSCNALNASEWHIRFSFQKVFAEKICVQPCCMVSSFHGNGISYKSGEYQQLDLGCNIYPAKTKCRCGMHYIVQQGDLISQNCNFFVFQMQLML